MKRQTYTKIKLRTRAIAMFMVVGLLIALLGAGVVASQGTSTTDNGPNRTRFEEMFE